ncbi:MAG: type I-F CRISPR-associated endoribonuclease Cas6/Csy4, partial [Acinetobacter sp.]
MKYYLELQLLPDDDISAHFLLAKVYTQLHIALAEIKDTNNKVNIGVSFPQYIFEEKIEDKKAKVNMGKKLRLFAQNEADLKKLDLKKWL